MAGIRRTDPLLPDARKTCPVTEIILSNARIVLPTETLLGHLVIRDGKIAEIAAGATAVPYAQDCAGDLLSPGLIELHTDNLERHMQPRPNVDWPHPAAMSAHDAELASVGITTVFDALRVGSMIEKHHRYKAYARAMASEILQMRARGALRISHFIHLRAETCSETLLEELAEFNAADRVGLVSLMDHTPGQRQFRDRTKHMAYIRGKTGISETEYDERAIFLEALQARVGAKHEAGTVAEAARLGAVLASHDDTTAEHVTTSSRHGVRVAEFPTTREAAQACRDVDIAVMMGAPNLIRGGSHSGNVSAVDLARADLLDILSSDYVPASLLNAAVQLGEIWGDMARGLATVSAAPAKAVGLVDRGRIVQGLRADLVRIGLIDGLPITRGLWVQGKRVG